MIEVRILGLRGNGSKDGSDKISKIRIKGGMFRRTEVSDEEGPSRGTDEG